jgi:uncharacterized protein YkwD
MPAPSAHRRPLPLVLAVLAALALLLAPAASAKEKHAVQRKAGAAAVGGTCPDEDLKPAPGNLAAIRAAVLCLHNRIRAEHGLPRLKENPRLRRAAARHSADMVARGYFSHRGPGGDSFVDRIVGSRYAGDDDGWILGENLAWGTDSLGTPAGVMEAWMASPDHRANVLRRGYREVGLGIATGVPSDRGAGATYTADFGVRR